MKQETAVLETQQFRPLDLKKKTRAGEFVIQALLFLAGFLSIFITLAIVYELGKEAWLFFGNPDVTFAKFLGTTTWQPSIGNFGIWPLVTSTLITSFIAIFVSLPLGLAAALFLSEYASARARSTLKPILEILAGIPTVVYGYFALLFMTPILQAIFGAGVEVYNMASAGIVMGIMILPLISSMSEDALSAVPRTLREGAYAMGATKYETSLQVVLPAALSGIGAALIIGISRAVGETMIVAVAAGSGPNFTFNPFKAAETMTGHIARISGGDLSYNSIDYTSLFAIALMLFLVTLVLNLISEAIINRFRQRGRMNPNHDQYPEGDSFRQSLGSRYRLASIWQALFFSALVIAMLSLAALLYNILDGAVGYVAYDYKHDPAEFTAKPLEDLNEQELLAILKSNLSSGAYNKLNNEQPMEKRSRAVLYTLVLERIIQIDTKETWSMTDSIFHGKRIKAEVAEKYPGAQLEFRSWLTPVFLTTPMSSKAEFAGVRTAILGSLWMVWIAMLFALPIGIGAAIYLQEYATKNFINRVIQTNINNLAGVPSIVYGMLGLAIFVRTFEPFTSGSMFGITDTNGRTILSAGLTMGILVLPLIIINAQEAIKAVPDSLRQAAFGVGATRWQTVWHHVLPNALPGILTGSILAVSRALGETAPLIIVGASTFISIDPDGPFSKFTALPIQIYQWTTRAQSEFHAIAASAIIVLLALLLTLNAAAVLLRNRIQRTY